MKADPETLRVRNLFSMDGAIGFSLFAQLRKRQRNLDHLLDGFGELRFDPALGHVDDSTDDARDHERMLRLEREGFGQFLHAFQARRLKSGAVVIKVDEEDAREARVFVERGIEPRERAPHRIGAIPSGVDMAEELLLGQTIGIYENRFAVRKRLVEVPRGQAGLSADGRDRGALEAEPPRHIQRRPDQPLAAICLAVRESLPGIPPFLLLHTAILEPALDKVHRSDNLTI